MAEDRDQDECMPSDPLKKGYEEDQVENLAGRGWGIRHVQAAVLATASFMGFCLRMNLSMAIVAMVKNNNNGTNVTSSEDASPRTFDWNEEKQGYILSSFFWGYIIFQIPAGIITEKYGGHRFLCLSILGSSFLGLFTPQSAYIGDWWLVCINRMGLGMSQGFLFSSIFTMLGLWSPPLERSRFMSITLGATFLGMVVSQPVSGYLVKMFGWPSVFYAFGGAGIPLGILMYILGADSPASHKMISEEERHYIQSSLGGAKVQMKVPWTHIFTSPPYLSALFCSLFHGVVYIMFLTKIPTYLATVLKFSIDDSGVLSALPYLVAYIVNFILSAACDFMTSRNIVNLTVARKLSNSIAHFGGAILIILMAHVENRAVSVFLICAFMGCQSGIISGVQANFVDLAPNFSGAIFSFSNFSVGLIALTGPIIVGLIVTETGSTVQWRIVFYLCALTLVLSNTVYLIWGNGKTQWWNWPDRYIGKEDFKKSHKEKNEERRKESLPKLSLT